MKKIIFGLMLLSSFSVFSASVECSGGESYDVKYAVSNAQSELSSKIKKIEAVKKADPQVSKSVSLSNLVMTQTVQANGYIAVSICVIVD